MPPAVTRVGSPRLAFAIQLALILLALLVSKPDKAGDFFEYGVTTVAIASHAAPACQPR